MDSAKVLVITGNLNRDVLVRKLEEGADPDSLEEELGEEPAGSEPGPGEAREPRSRSRSRRAAPSRDPKLYDYT